MSQEIAVKEQIIRHLEGGEAFLPVGEFLDDISFTKVGIRPAGLPYSFYEIFYHITFVQRDILAYTTTVNYQARTWPGDYWPAYPSPVNETAWEELKAEYFEDRMSLSKFIKDDQNELMASVLNSQEHSLLRELLLVIEHTAYHTGQLQVIRRLLDVYDN